MTSVSRGGCYACSSMIARELADTMVLGVLLDALRERAGGYELVAHWKQGEFHQDLVLRVPAPGVDAADRFLVVATNCNGGVKEVLLLASLPDRSALWHFRCPLSGDFAGELPPVLERAVTPHWFDPCELLGADARSELRPEFRKRQAGGGWEMASAVCAAPDLGKG